MREFEKMLSRHKVGCDITLAAVMAAASWGLPLESLWRVLLAGIGAGLVTAYRLAIHATEQKAKGQG